ncbi:MAG: DUF4239 domain-containing protein [Fluviibacter sp.]
MLPNLTFHLLIMPFDLLKSLTDIQVLLVYPILACSVLLLLTLFFRQFREPLGLAHYDSDIVDTATQNTMSGAYVVMGFVLVLAMTTVSDLENSVSQEATAIKSLERLLVMDTSPIALKAREHLIQYTESVLKDEWPGLSEGKINPQTSAELRQLFLSLDAFNPKTPKDTVLYGKILEAADKTAELRNSRNYNIQSNLPGTFYIVSFVSLLGVMIICALRLVEATPMRSIALTVQIIMLTLMFSAIVIIDLPYIGETVTSPDAISSALNSMKARMLPVPQ